MNMFLVPFLGICGFLGASAASSCLDPTDTAYSCEVSPLGLLALSSCDITDEDVDEGNLASCLDNAGRELVETLSLWGNALTTLPVGIFEGLTSMDMLRLSDNALTTLPAEIFEDLTALESLYLYENALATLPAGIFEDLTALKHLYLYDNALTTLPAGIFEGQTALESLELNNNALTTLPAGIFESLTALESLELYDNALTTLPASIFEGLTDLTDLELNNNALTTLPAGIFDGLTNLTELWLSNNALTTFPAGIFEGLTNLATLKLDGNDLECLPIIPERLVELDDDATHYADGLHVDVYGEDCGCSAANRTEVCGEEICTPGPFGYTCDPAVATPAPVLPATTAPVPAAMAPEGASDTTPTIAGVISAVAVAVLIGLGLWLRRRRSGQKSRENSQPLPSTSRDLEGDPGFEPPTGSGTVVLLDDSDHPSPHDEGSSLPPASHTEADASASNGEGIVSTSEAAEPAMASAAAAASAVDGAAALVLGYRDKKPTPRIVAPHPHTTAEDAVVDGGDAFTPSAPPALVAENSGAGPAGENNAAGGSLSAPTGPPAEKGGVVGLAGGEDAAGGLAEKLLESATSFATVSTANLSTVEQEELAQFRQRQYAGDSALVVSGSNSEGEPPVGGAGRIGASSASAPTSRQSSSTDVGLGQVVLASAQELARSCQIPGVSEAAGVVCIMANLFTDNRDNDQASKSRLRQCRSIVLALKRADKVVGKGGDTIEEAARVLIEDVYDAIFDLVELIKAFQTKNKLSKLFMSTLFKRRQEELDSVVSQAIMRLQLGLQLQTGQDVSAVKDDVSAVKDNFDSVREGMDLYQRSIAEATSESVAEARRIKRQRKLDQVEIPEEQLSITDEVLGKGGFGEVYLADYNGHNAAAKVLYIPHDVGGLNEKQTRRDTRRAFLRELEAMIRLRSPNTVNVYGAVTSWPDRMVLVMELLVGGDLATMLQKSRKSLPEEQSRRIIRDICTGMAFLHGKSTVHGDLKSANVLLDGSGRAKIGDFGTSRWSQHTSSTGLATYTTKSSQSTQMSLAWSAPEVLDSHETTYKSDVYSFGIVVWEVLSRQLPWSNKTRPSQILSAVLMGVRPSFPVDAPPDIVDIAKACWGREPEERTMFSAILDEIRARGWSE